LLDSKTLTKSKYLLLGLFALLLNYLYFSLKIPNRVGLNGDSGFSSALIYLSVPLFVYPTLIALLIYGLKMKNETKKPIIWFMTGYFISILIQAVFYVALAVAYLEGSF